MIDNRIYKVRASPRLGETKTAVHTPALPSSFLMPGTSPDASVSGRRSVAQARAGLYIS